MGKLSAPPKAVQTPTIIYNMPAVPSIATAPAPEPEPVPVMPDTDSAAVEENNKKARAKQAQRSGKESTFLRDTESGLG
jgi:hypothetical protein